MVTGHTLTNKYQHKQLTSSKGDNTTGENTKANTVGSFCMTEMWWLNSLCQQCLSHHYSSVVLIVMDAIVDTKLGQIGSKWDKSWTLKDQFLYILVLQAKMYRNWYLKVPDLSHLGPMWANLESNLAFLGEQKSNNSVILKDKNSKKNA